MKIWTCKIGQTKDIPKSADLYMRKAIAAAYYEITGERCDFIFSGWGGELTENELAVLEEGLSLSPFQGGKSSKVVDTDKLLEENRAQRELLEKFYQAHLDAGTQYYNDWQEGYDDCLSYWGSQIRSLLKNQTPGS